jgi:hypothetical protein
MRGPVSAAGTCELHQNYPNPFNPSTTIWFDLPRASRVSLKVINVLGQCVIELLNGWREAGICQVRWDASNVPNGMYFYRLHANGESVTRSMVLLR